MKHAWVNQNPLMEEFVGSTIIDENEKVFKFIEINKNWNVRKLRNVLPQTIVQNIFNAPVPVYLIKDRVYWRFTRNGWFSTSSVIKLITNNDPNKRGNTNWI